VARGESVNYKHSGPEPDDGSDGVALIERLLLGSDEEIQRAIDMLLCHKGLRTKVCSRVRKKFASLPSWQLADVWTDAVTSVWKKASQGTYKNHKPLEAILTTITRRRATDAMRRLYGRSKRKRPDQPVEEQPSGSAPASDVEAPAPSARPKEWTMGELAELYPDAQLAGDAKCEELLEAVRVFAATLPCKQQLALRAFARAWPNPTDIAITTIVRETAPKASLKSVRRALQEAFEKLRIWLAKQCPEWEEYLGRFLIERERRRQQRRHVTAEAESALSHVANDESSTRPSPEEAPKEHDGER
jgi:DNA-directed RNA polymerase specialized sigma24 family protein